MRLEEIGKNQLIIMLCEQSPKFVDIMLRASCHTVWDGDSLIGMVGYNANPHGLMIVQYIQVKDDLRRKGYGLKILKMLESIAKKHRCYGMRLIFKDRNLEEFYRKATVEIPMLVCEFVED